MLDTLLHSHFAAGLISGGLAVAARDLAMGLIASIGLAFNQLKKHPNDYVSAAQLDEFHQNLLTAIATQAAAAAQQPTVAVTVAPVPVPVPVKEPARAPDIPVYNQD